jgi:hypothetical protein
MTVEGAAPPRTWSDEELRRMFEDERASQIEHVKFRATRSLVSNLILVAIASILFLTHWRWLRRESAGA